MTEVVDQTQINHDDTPPLPSSLSLHISTMKVEDDINSIHTTQEEQLIDDDEEDDEEDTDDTIYKIYHPIKQYILQNTNHTKIQPVTIYTTLIILLTILSIPQLQSLSIWTIQQIIKFVLTIVGTTIGVAFGLGFVEYVKDCLETAHDTYHHGDNDDEGRVDGNGSSRGLMNPKRRGSIMSNTSIVTSSSTTTTGAIAAQQQPTGGGGLQPSSSSGEENSYVSLMHSAGYAIPQGIIRGQILRNVTSSNNGSNGGNGVSGGDVDQSQNPYNFIRDVRERNSLYSFPTKATTTTTNNPSINTNTTNENQETDNKNNQQQEVEEEVPYSGRGRIAFQRMWPNLPSDVQTELGTFVDYILRDYVTVWYASVDEGIRYEDEATKRQRLHNSLNLTKVTTDENEDSLDDYDDDTTLQDQTQKSTTTTTNTTTTTTTTTTTATMVLSTAPSRTIPFIELLYTFLTTVLGNLCTYAGDNVNVSEVILVKFLNILKMNVKVYREIRKSVLDREKRRRKKKSMLERKKNHQGSSSSSSNNLTGSNSGGGGRKRLSRSRSPIKKTKSNTSPLSFLEESLKGSEDGMSIMNEIAERHSFERDSGGGGIELQPSSSSSPQRPSQQQSSSSSSPDKDKGEGSNNREKRSNRRRRKMESVSEITMVREYLLQGKLHRAITFGMDVPGLLFGDMKGKECPLPKSYNDEDENLHHHDNSNSNNNNNKNSNTTNDDNENDVDENKIQEDEILQKRLFGNGQRLLYECELDYNRIIAHRLCRILFPRTDFNSPVGRSMCVEMTASCILAPSMACCNPEYLNGWIQKGLEVESETTTTDAESGHKEQDLVNTVSGEMKQAESVEEDEMLKDAVLGHSETYESLERTDTCENDFDETDIDDNPDDESDISYDGSNSGSEDNLSFEDEGDEISPAISVEDPSYTIMPLLTMSLIELQSHVDFDDARIARENEEEIEGVDWADQDCCKAVRDLVLVIEAALIHGMLGKNCRKRILRENNEEGTSHESQNETGVEGQFVVPGESSSKDPNHQEASSLLSLLMKITSDLESFEKKFELDYNGGTNDENLDDSVYYDSEENLTSLPRPNTSDLSSLRTLIAAWLHTGMLYRTIAVLIQCRKNILQQFYHQDAFFNSENAPGFVRQLRVLNDVDILVDTTSLLSSPPLDLKRDFVMNPLMEEDEDCNEIKQPASTELPTGNSQAIDGKQDDTNSTSMGRSTSKSEWNRKMQRYLEPSKTNGFGSIKANFENNRKRFNILARVGSNRSSPPEENISLSQSMTSMQQNTPQYLQFHSNEKFATNLRIERKRRIDSFTKISEDFSKDNKMHVEMICRSHGASEKHVGEHRELHNLAKTCHSNSMAIAIHSVKPPKKDDSGGSSGDVQERKMTVLMTETLSSRRKWELPIDDSSFLLRAQPKPLNVLGVHRDKNDYNLSYKKYAAYYDEPTPQSRMKYDRGGRLRRKYFLHYYPSDKSSSISLPENSRRLDHRNGQPTETKNLPTDLQPLQRRHPCYLSVINSSDRGNSVSTPSNTLMDGDDFCLSPRTGRCNDFVYRMSLYEGPIVEISGKKLVVQDSTVFGPHQADASSLELSDAALSAALLLCTTETSTSSEQNVNASVKCSPEGMPLLFMRLNDTSANKSKGKALGVRPYRVSSIRAALMIESAKHEAQMQCLLFQTRQGSTKNLTKSRVDALLRPTLTLLEFATSKKREKQSVLLRDLKLGINHIDREQLRRNGLLTPRFPTLLKQLKVTVESAVQTNQNLDLMGSTILFKIRCVTVTEYIDVHGDANDYDSVAHDKPIYGDLYSEEWVVMRSFRDFSTLHKFLKSQVSSNESSGSAGAKIVGAATGLATAALSIGNQPSATHAKRKALIPSLSQGSKGGPLVSTSRFIEKRRVVLNDYLAHLLSPRNLLNRCPELLKFLGAYDAFPPEVKPNSGVLTDFTDSIGRCDMCKSLLQRNGSPISRQANALVSSMSQSADPVTNSVERSVRVSKKASKKTAKKERRKRRAPLDPSKIVMLARIKSHIERVKFKQVRSNTFELLRYIFDLDSANFFRSRMISALKTVSFAVTTGQEFNRMLVDLHLKYLNGKYIGSYIKYARELIWPDGIIFKSAPQLNREEKDKLKAASNSALHNAFPDQLKAVLGHDCTEKGLDVLHEMLQNRIIVKSMGYMMMDALLVEIFPEMGDVLTCSQALDNS